MRLIQQIVEAQAAGSLAELRGRWGATVDARFWLSRALWIDQPATDAQPTMLLPALLRRIEFAGDPAFEPYYVGDKSKYDLRAIRELAPWVRERIAPPWLHALRPPGCPLDGPVYWEMRGERTLDEVFPGSAGIRGYGRIGGVTIVDADGESGSHGVFVDGRELWEHYGDVRAAAVDGDRIAIVGSTGAIAVRDLRTGALRLELRSGRIDELGFAGGRVVSRAGAVIRVHGREAWRNAALSTKETHVAAQFSPDGRTLVTGDLLCDARSGQIRARIPLMGSGGWLEGGPPENPQGVTDARVVEVMPFRTQTFDVRTGAMRALPRCAARVLDRIEYDREGAVFGVVPMSGVATVYSLEDGEPREVVGDWTRRDDPRIDVQGGILQFGGAELPWDDAYAVISPDGRFVAGPTSHAELVT